MSINISTYNSSTTLEICLKSIRNQKWHEDIEVIVVDSYSLDNTREIAEKFGFRIITTKDKHLGVRYRGFKESEDEYVLLLDADQILDETAIVRAVDMLKEYDMVCLEEHSYKPRTWFQRLIKADRHVVRNLASIHLVFVTHKAIFCRIHNESSFISN